MVPKASTGHKKLVQKSRKHTPSLKIAPLTKYQQLVQFVRNSAKNNVQLICSYLEIATDKPRAKNLENNKVTGFCQLVINNDCLSSVFIVITSDCKKYKLKSIRQLEIQNCIRKFPEIKNHTSWVYYERRHHLAIIK